MYTIPKLENGKIQKSAIAAEIFPEELIAAANISGAMKDLGFNWTQIEMIAITSKLCERFQQSWGLKTEHRKLWIATMAMRIRCVLCKTDEAVKKTDRPKWLRRIPCAVAEYSAPVPEEGKQKQSVSTRLRLTTSSLMSSVDGQNYHEQQVQDVYGEQVLQQHSHQHIDAQQHTKISKHIKKKIHTSTRGMTA